LFEVIKGNKKPDTLQPGQQVRWFMTTEQGLRVYVGQVRLQRTIGTVPNYWEFLVLEGRNVGKLVKGFIYKEDQHGY
jgi:hypothetical protein